MKILVTGGAGFIGSHLVDELIAQGNKVIVIDNLSTGKKENLNPKADFYNLDICDFEKIKPLFQDVDYVFHLAAIPRVPISVEDPIGTSKINILGTINVFKAASDNKIKRVIFVSSSSVYGNQKELPLREAMIPDPISPYALQKLVGEQFANLFTQLYNIPIISLRYFNVYGPRVDFDSEYSLVIGKFLKLKKEQKPLTIFGDGEQTRAFCYVDDVVEANIKAMKSKFKNGEVFNIGTGKTITINEIATYFNCSIEHIKPRSGEPFQLKADTTKSRKLLKWQAKISFEKGIKRYFKS